MMERNITGRVVRDIACKTGVSWPLTVSFAAMATMIYLMLKNELDKAENTQKTYSTNNNWLVTDNIYVKVESYLFQQICLNIILQNYRHSGPQGFLCRHKYT